MADVIGRKDDGKARMTYEPQADMAPVGLAGMGRICQMTPDSGNYGSPSQIDRTMIWISFYSQCRRKAKRGNQKMGIIEKGETKVKRVLASETPQSIASHFQGQPGV